MRTPLVAGNWKLNGSRAGNDALLGGVLKGLGEAGAVDVMVCPPYVYLPDVVARVADTGVLVGGQDVSEQAGGAFTGEVSAAMLRDVGCTHVIVGHSERRSLFGESDDSVAAKHRAARQAGLTPILCVGESLAERESGATLDVVTRQMRAVLAVDGPEALDGGIIAYEPVWAIGTGRTASPDQAQEVHAAIRQLVAGLSARIAGDLRILYGGSVKGANARELFSMNDIDGGLIGGASLDADEFLAICAAASIAG